MSVPSLEWQQRAACAGLPVNLFFGPDPESPLAQQAREAQAKAICRRCPVMVLCGRHAITSGVRHGVWGAFGETELARARRSYLRCLRGYAA